MAKRGDESKGELGEAPAPHYLGHRERARQRFLQVGAEALADYELLELVLQIIIPRRDTKPLAKELLQKFGSFSNVLGAAPARLAEVRGWARCRPSASRSSRRRRSASPVTRCRATCRSSARGRR
jgi:DNA repair protein RadC